MASAVWLIRAGRHGEREELALGNSIATIGWAELGDLSGIKTREQLHERMVAVHPDESKFTINNWVSQVWPMLSTIQEGDIVAMPLKRTSGIALGRVTGPYRYRPEFTDLDASHTRAVQWLEKPIPRSSFGQDLLYSLGAFMTVCRITRNDAGSRIDRIFNGQADSAAPSTAAAVPGAPEPEVAERDLEADARSAIMDRVIRNFKGHELEYLVAAVLKAQGYVVERTEKGADGGVDLTAGRGDFGFDAPRICVQVKSNAGPIDVTPLRELQGALKNFGADHGLFVAWGGFTTAALREARRSFFQLRLWSADDLIGEMLSVYPSLPDDIRTAVPLQQIWTLVPEVSQVKG